MTSTDQIVLSLTLSKLHLATFQTKIRVWFRNINVIFVGKRKRRLECWSWSNSTGCERKSKSIYLYFKTSIDWKTVWLMWAQVYIYSVSQTKLLTCRTEKLRSKARRLYGGGVCETLLPPLVRRAWWSIAPSGQPYNQKNYISETCVAMTSWEENCTA
jgi:hypothetical protein